MAAKIWIGIRSRATYLRRLSVVFAVEVRLKIVTELYMREMSPKQFYEEFGGGSISRVAQNFERLAEAGWLRYVRSEGPGGKRRGAVEHFYRATELAFCDAETWAMLPYSIRVAFTWSSFKEIAERVREAIAALTFAARQDRQMVAEQVKLDQRGWDNVIAAVDGQFVSQFEEQEDARTRAGHSGERLFRASAVLMAFESPRQGQVRNAPEILESTEESMTPLLARLSKVFADEVCMQIVADADRRETSALAFHAEFGGDVQAIRRRFKVLERIGLLKKVGEKSGGRRRAGTEKFYRATGPAFTDDGPLTDVPPSVRESSNWMLFERLSTWVLEAMRAGTFDGRKDRYLAWTILNLDTQGWENVVAGMKDLLAFIREEQTRAEARMALSGETPITMTIGLAAFESPAGSEKAH